MTTLTRIDDYSTSAKSSIRVRSHWNDNTLVELLIDEQCYTVSAEQLRRAIENATNVPFQRGSRYEEF